MSWSARLMASLDERSSMVQTECGVVQLGREGTGPPVLVIHGGPGGFDQGLGAGRHLRDGGCQVLAPSRPGYLRTPLESGPQPEDQADLYAALLDAIGVERAAILGISSGGPSAVHFAARHPERATALILDGAVLLPLANTPSRLDRLIFGSGLGVWFLYQMATKRPTLLTSMIVDAFAAGFDKGQAKAAVEWINSSPLVLDGVTSLIASLAPREYREVGQANDEANESQLPSLPFADIASPTLIGHGTNDRLVPAGHAKAAAEEIADAELMLIEEGLHVLPLCRNHGALAQRQIELVHG